jgi:rubrerythrin
MTKIIQPTYITKLPSTGETVKFRPFTVKEEKALLLALQEDNITLIADSINNVISVCTFEKIDPEKIPYFDTEFLFLQIRSKSVGEVLELEGSCDCSETAKTEVFVNIEKPTITSKPTGNLKLKIADTAYNIELRYPSLSDFVAAFIDKNQTGFETVAKCIVSVYNEEEVFDLDFNEKLDFVESMSPKQQKKIATFLEKMPEVKLDATYICKACGKKHEVTISGYESFFV